MPGKHSLSGVRAIANEWAYFAEHQGFDRVLEKTPKHIYAYRQIQKLFPDNRIIVMVLNPMDTIASLYKRFGDLRLAIERWKFDNSEALRLKNNKK